MSQPNQNNNPNFKDTKIFVGGLAWRTTTDELRRSFQQFGEVIDANVVSEGLPGGNLRSKGYGFVVFRNAESANRACQIPWLVVDGRQTNVNMAYLGAKNNSNQSNQNGLLNQAGPSHQYQNGLFNQAASHQYQPASHNPNQHFPQPYWAPYYGHHPYMYDVPCYSYPTAMVSVQNLQLHQHVSAYRMQRNWQRMNNISGVTITNPNAEVNEANEEFDEADEEVNGANEEVNEANEEVNEANEEIIEANEQVYTEEISEEEAYTETNSDQEGEHSGEDNDINQEVNDQELEIMSGEEDDTKQDVDATKQLGNGVEGTLQSEIVCEEEAENTPQGNGDQGEKQEYIKELVREAI